MAIRILTDSTSDLPRSLQAQLDIEIIPLSVCFGQEVFADGVDLLPQEFYQKLREADALPTTSCVPVATFEAAFERALQAGDEVLGIFLSSELSATFQSAVIAAQNLQSERITLVDSQNVALGLALLVYRAVAYRDAGLCAADIAAKLEEEKQRVRLYAMIDTLKYLKMGGRLSGASAAMGTLLSVKPVASIQQGTLQVVHKARGKKKALAYLLTRLDACPVQPGTPVFLGNTDCREEMEAYQPALRAHLPQDARVYTLDIGSTVGTHAGPGCMGFAYLERP